MDIQTKSKLIQQSNINRKVLLELLEKIAKENDTTTRLEYLVDLTTFLYTKDIVNNLYEEEEGRNIYCDCDIKDIYAEMDDKGYYCLNCECAIDPLDDRFYRDY